MNNIEWTQEDKNDFEKQEKELRDHIKMVDDEMEAISSRSPEVIEEKRQFAEEAII